MLIQLKDKVNIESKNEQLKKQGVKNSFQSPERNERWLKDVNTNPKSPQSHWKPSNRDLTMEELKDLAGVFGIEGRMDVEMCFERTSVEEAYKIADFIVKNKEDIDYLEDVTEFIEDGEIPQQYHELLINLIEKPRELSEDEKVFVSDEINDGQLLCKARDGEKIYVNFGHVSEPIMMKNMIYTQEKFNPLHRDSEGNLYMLIPLMPMSGVAETDIKFASRVFSGAKELGVTEDPYFFIPYIYKMGIDNIDSVAEGFKVSYTVEERLERLTHVFKTCGEEFMLSTPRRITQRILSLKRNGTLIITKYGKKEEKEYFMNRLSLLNALILSLKDDLGKALVYWHNIEQDEHIIEFRKGRSKKTTKCTF